MEDIDYKMKEIEPTNDELASLREGVEARDLEIQRLLERNEELNALVRLEGEKLEKIEHDATVTEQKIEALKVDWMKLVKENVLIAVINMLNDLRNGDRTVDEMKSSLKEEVEEYEKQFGKFTFEENAADLYLDLLDVEGLSIEEFNSAHVKILGSNELLTAFPKIPSEHKASWIRALLSGQ